MSHLEQLTQVENLEGQVWDTSIDREVDLMNYADTWDGSLVTDVPNFNYIKKALEVTQKKVALLVHVEMLPSLASLIFEFTPKAVYLTSDGSNLAWIVWDNAEKYSNITFNYLAVD